MVLHNAHVIEYLQGDKDWHDATLEAGHWAALSDIAPCDAALLLCRFNPNDDDYENARLITTDELGPEHLTRLEQRLTDIDKTDHRPRTLRDWFLTARGAGLRFHSWVSRYMEATTPEPDQTPAPEVAEDASTPLQAVPNWKMKIQAEATAHCLTLRKAGANPTKNSIVDSMAQWCRDNNVMTDGGIYPSANYLRTHVLGGQHWDWPR